MPPAAYKLMHGDARLSVADLERLAQGLTQTLGTAVDQAAREPAR